MTEYEIADLALSTQEGIRQQVGLVQEQASLALSSLSVYFSLIFGYLLAAYFVVANLTRAQNVILTLLYLSTIFLNRSAFLSIQLGGKDLNMGLMELNPDARPVFILSDAGNWRRLGFSRTSGSLPAAVVSGAPGEEIPVALRALFISSPGATASESFNRLNISDVLAALQ